MLLLAGTGPGWAIERVSVAADGTQGNADSLSTSPVSMSADGRFVAFASDASNLVPGDTNANQDVFVKDRTTGAIERMSARVGGTPEGNFASFSPSISADGPGARPLAQQAAASLFSAC